MLVTVVIGAFFWSLLVPKEHDDHITEPQNPKKAAPINTSEQAIKDSEKIDTETVEIQNLENAQSELEVVTIEKPSLPPELEGMPFFIIRDELLKKIESGDTEAMHLLGQLSYRCIGAPSTSEEEFELIETYYREIDSSPEFEQNLKNTRKSCLGYDDNVHRHEMITLLITAADSGNIFSALLFADVPPTEEIYNDKDKLEEFNQKRLQLLEKAFSEGSLDAALRLSAEYAIGNDEESTLLRYVYSEVASSFISNNFLRKQKEVYFDDLPYWQREEALKRARELKSKINKSGNTFRINF